MCLAPPDQDGRRPRTNAAMIAAELRELDAGVAGRVFAATKGGTVFPSRFKAFEEGLPAQMGISRLQDAVHDMLSPDPKALENVDAIFAYIDQAMAG
eukprot:7133999-Prymnesium_polylepis.1